MRIDENKKIWLACADDEIDSRRQLQCIKYDGKTLLATDGRIIAVIDADTDKEDYDKNFPFLIHADFFKLAKVRAGQIDKSFRIYKEQIETDMDHNGRKIKFNHEKLKHYPVKENLDKITKILKRNISNEQSFMVAINVDYLKNLAEALGSTNIILYLDPAKLSEKYYGECIAVTTEDKLRKVKDYGGIMPRRID